MAKKKITKKTPARTPRAKAAPSETPAGAAAQPGRPSPLVDTRVVYCGDNLVQLRRLPDECVDLVYIDPPFNSNRNYEVFWGESKERRSFEDRHESTRAYIDFMRPRCVELHRVLKKTGSFYFHCDWHASHYVKVMLDQIFGENQFRSEIIWRRTNAKGLATKGFPNNHDNIYYYTKTKDFVWNRPFKKHDPSYIEKFYRHIEAETGRRYTLGDLTNPNPDRPNLTYEWKGITRVWRWTRERMEAADRDGILEYTSSGLPRQKRYLDEVEGQPIDTLWDDIPPIHAHADERLGYPTQKPLALLERIIKASSNENDIVLDAFCGCGTALVAAQNLNRQWIGIDVSPTACRVMAKRLRDVCGLRENEGLWRNGRGFVVRDLPKTEEELRKYPPFEFENWAVTALSGIGNSAKVGDMGIDGRIFLSDRLPTERGEKTGELDFMGDFYPIQVKQTEKAGRPVVDQFQAVMMREDVKKGFIVAFGFTADAERECADFYKRTGKKIELLTVAEILDLEKEELAYKLA